MVRDGGTSSILTRVALIEQNIENIKKWMDNHVDVHQRMKKDFSEVREHLLAIERRLASVEKTLHDIEEEAQEKEREQRDSIVREMDLAAERKKADEMVRAQTQSAQAKVRAERQSAIVKIIATVVIGVLGLIGGYLMKSCTGTEIDPGTGQMRIVPAQPTSSGSPQTP